MKTNRLKTVLGGLLSAIVLMEEAVSQTPAATYQSTVLADSPVGYWGLNEAAGATSFIDGSGNGNTGASLGDRAPISGVLGAACTTGASFDGAANNITSDVIQVPHRASINFINNFSFEAWVKWDGSPGYRIAVSKPRRDNGVQNGTSSALGVYNGVPIFANITTSGFANTPFTGSTIAPGVFHHLVGTFSNGVARIYVNGAFMSSGSGGGATIVDVGTPAALNIGREFATLAGLSDRAFPGVIDEVAVYQSVLTPARVLAHYNAGLCLPPNTAPIVSCHPVATIPCTSPGGATRTVTIDVSDADNDALTVTWTVNGVALAPHLLAAGATSDNLTDYAFGFGLNTVSVSVTDGKSDAVTCDTTVTVTAHDAPVPSLASLPTITGECSASITQAPTATDPCAVGGIVTGVSSLGPLPLHFAAQGNYTVTWTYTSPHDGMLSTTQDQTVIVKDVTPPTITCPPDVSVAFGSVPAAATDPAGFLAQGGTITDNCDPNGSVTSFDLEEGYCPTIITRFYVVTDAAGNTSDPCVQTITVDNLFAEDGILWLQPLARNGASTDTDPGAGGTLKYRFKLGSTIPIKVQAQGCDGNVSANANVGGKVVVFGDTDMDGVVDAGEIDYNGVGEAGGVMGKVDGKLQFNLDTKKLIQTFKCYILQVTVTDSSTGESRVETLALQVK